MDFLGKADINDTKKKINKGKVLKILAVILFIILVITMIILYEKNEKVRNFFDIYIFRKMINEENVPSIDIDTSKNREMVLEDILEKIIKEAI